MAKPLWGKWSTRKMSLKDRWAFAASVGIDVRTNEHTVVLGDGGGAANTCADVAPTCRAIKATPRTPNPKNCVQQHMWICIFEEERSSSKRMVQIYSDGLQQG